MVATQLMLCVCECVCVAHMICIRYKHIISIITIIGTVTILLLLLLCYYYVLLYILLFLVQDSGFRECVYEFSSTGQNKSMGL